MGLAVFVWRETRAPPPPASFLPSSSATAVYSINSQVLGLERAGDRSSFRHPAETSCFLLTRCSAIDVFSPSSGMMAHATR